MLTQDDFGNILRAREYTTIYDYHMILKQRSVLPFPTATSVT